MYTGKKLATLRGGGGEGGEGGEGGGRGRDTGIRS